LPLPQIYRCDPPHLAQRLHFVIRIGTPSSTAPGGSEPSTPVGGGRPASPLPKFTSLISEEQLLRDQLDWLALLLGLRRTVLAGGGCGGNHL
jgi:hypothetical protein